MTEGNERWRQIDEILAAALELPPDERAGLLDQACADDRALRYEVEALLRADAAADELFDRLGRRYAEECGHYLTSLGRDTGAGAADELPETIAHFTVLGLLGSGGMGEVLLAHDTRLDRRVALKLIHKHRVGSPRAREDFLREARTTARFNHPHIVTIHEVGEYQGSPFLALEYLQGQSLRERLDQGRLELPQALAIGQAIAEALAEAHRHGVLHRDLKPGNVFLPEDGRLRVLDFGTAKVSFGLGVPHHAAGTVGSGPSLAYGTPAYMAPEQWQGGQCTPATDLWAFGMVLLELVAGEHPWSGASPAEMMHRACASSPEVVIPAAITTDWPELAGLIRRCLDPRPERRPTAEAVARMLSDLLAHGDEPRSGRAQAVLAARMLAYSWLAAGAGWVLALLVVVVGQGLGAMLGGCSWIGMTVPLHRQPWALVNQPDMAYSFRAVAAGYWLGSSLLPLLVAALLAGLQTRLTSTAGRLLVLQISWACVVVGGGWVPLLDPQDGHPAQWLRMHGGSAVVWTVPLLALLVGGITAARLPHLTPPAGSQPPGGLRRLGRALLHLGVPTVTLIGLAATLRGSLPVAAVVACLLPLLGVVWLVPRRLPPAAPDHPGRLGPGSFAGVLLLLLLLAGVVAVAGRPTAAGGATGLLWAHKGSCNNVRPWITETSLGIPPPGATGSPPPS